MDFNDDFTPIGDEDALDQILADPIWENYFLAQASIIPEHVKQEVLASIPASNPVTAVVKDMQIDTPKDHQPEEISENHETPNVESPRDEQSEDDESGIMLPNYIETLTLAGLGYEKYASNPKRLHELAWMHTVVLFHVWALYDLDRAGANSLIDDVCLWRDF